MCRDMRTWSQMKRSEKMVPSKRARAPQLASRSCRYLTVDVAKSIID